MWLLPGWFSAAVPRGKWSNDASGVTTTKLEARAAISRAVVETVEDNVSGVVRAWPHT